VTKLVQAAIDHSIFKISHEPRAYGLKQGQPQPVRGPMQDLDAGSL